MMIPLVPHHVQQQRRRRQLSVPLTSSSERPQRYPRWLEKELQDDIPVAQQVAGLYQGYGVRTTAENCCCCCFFGFSLLIVSLFYFPQPIHRSRHITPICGAEHLRNVKRSLSIRVPALPPFRVRNVKNAVSPIITWTRSLTNRPAALSPRYSVAVVCTAAVTPRNNNVKWDNRIKKGVVGERKKSWIYVMSVAYTRNLLRKRTLKATSIRGTPPIWRF